MATKEQIEKVFEKMKELKPNLFLQNINSVNAGSIFVLCYLYEVKRETYASSLCEIMKISRARMSVLLEKVIAKGYIRKEVSASDARKEVLFLTPLGRKQVEDKQQLLKEDISKVIDCMGLEKIVNFIETAREINALLKKEKGEGNV